MFRCECKQLSFVALKSFARRRGITRIEDLMRATGCCTGCGRCRPYVEELLRSGKLICGDRLIDLPDQDPQPNDHPDLDIRKGEK